MPCVGCIEELEVKKSRMIREMVVAGQSEGSCISDVRVEAQPQFLS